MNLFLVKWYVDYSLIIMCGIAGFVDFRNESTHDVLVRMTDSLSNRGPDGSGYKVWQKANYCIGFGHRRLSIIDLSLSGSQPMVSSDDSLVIVFNGEIYNYKALQKELLELGHVFKSNSDTEVILNSFLQWGHGAIERFVGMFAFALYDQRLEKVFIYRDRTGIKPLFYYWDNGIFLFGSEMKALHGHPHFTRRLDLDSLELYLELGYVPAPHSIFESTYKLLPGHFLEIDLSKRDLNEVRYWDVFDYFNKPKLKLTESEAIVELEKLLREACEYRMVADVPVGVFLSGGYDSSLVASLLQKDRSSRIRTFTIGFEDEKFNEAPHAKRVAEYLGTQHTEYYCSPKDALDILPQLPTIFDEPFGDSSAIPTILVSKLARSDVKVALSADAGDETFAGYDKYEYCSKYYSRVQKIPKSLRSTLYSLMKSVDPTGIPLIGTDRFRFARVYEKLRRALGAHSAIDIMRQYSLYFNGQEMNSILLERRQNRLHTFFNDGHLLNSGNDPINQMLAVDYKTYLVDDVLTKVDRASMSVSLEGREPLVDHRLAEFSAQLLSSLKLNEQGKKYLLKKIVHKYVPRNIMERPKMGFGVPVQTWFLGELKSYFMQYLDESRLRKEGILNADNVVRLRSSYFANHQSHVHKLWFLLMFEMWYEKWMK